MKQKRLRILLVVLILLTGCLLAYGVSLLVEQYRLEKRMAEYPVAYVDEIRSGAEEFGLDPYFVIAVVRCESSFDADAVSHRGAIGLMQVMPDTGTWIAHKLGMDDTYSESTLYDPATNIRFGCWYLNFVSGRFDGREREMIAAYNAGHRTVENWLEDPAYAQDGALTVIPYDDAALYYERVTAARAAYVELYPALFGDAAQIVQTPAA